MYAYDNLCVIFVVNGGWSEWKNISVCSATCGGVKPQSRSCSEPPRSCGGKACEGKDLRFIPCNKIG